MSTDAHYHPRGVDIDLAKISTDWPDLYNEIISLKGHIRRADPPVLTCLGNFKSMLVYQSWTGRYFCRHFAGEACPRKHVLGTGGGMSAEHLRQAEYAARAAQNAGFDARLEVNTGGGTRLDVGVFGDQQIGFEIQRSELSRAEAKKRCVKSFKAGWPTGWVHDRSEDTDWNGHVPTIRLKIRDVWSQRLPAANTQEAIIWKFWRERDRSKKSGWSYNAGKVDVLFDELASLMPAGEIVPVVTGSKNKIVRLAYRDAIDVIDSCTFPGASLWRPDPTTPRQQEAAQSITRHCRHGITEDFEQLAPLPMRVLSEQAQRIRDIPVEFAECRRCGQSVHLIDTTVDVDLCYRCFVVTS